MIMSASTCAKLPVSLGGRINLTRSSISGTMSEEVGLFFKEATQELLFNIVDDIWGEIGYRELSEEFEERFGYRPMDFFGLENILGIGWFEFLEDSPDFCFDRKRVSIDDEYYNVYDHYNKTQLTPETSVAKYREMLLAQACKLSAKDGVSIDEKTSQDDNGNTALHLICGMPGTDGHEPTLLRYLLKAGADPMLENDDGLDILHIIAGRMKAEEDKIEDIYFGEDRIEASYWSADHRKAMLNIIVEELSPTQLTTLMCKPQGDDGNTVVHEWLLAMFTNGLTKPDEGHNLVKKEVEIGSILLSCGGNLRIPNKSGLVPLHLAFDSAVFQFLLQNGANCRPRNDQDETPFLFMLKVVFGLACHCFGNIAKEVEKPLPKGIDLKCSLKEAVILLQHLIKCADENKEFRKTSRIPDEQERYPLQILLVFIRVSSCKLKISFDEGLEMLSWYLSEQSHLRDLRRDLVKLLRTILGASDQAHLTQQNEKGQGPLHILLDMGSGDAKEIDAETEILQSLQLLLQHGVSVNVVDKYGQTALDVANKHANQKFSLYKKCTELLLINGAKSALQIHLDFPVVNAKRKLLGNSQRHSESAQQLADGTGNVTVVQKFRYCSEMPIGSGAFSCIYVALKDDHVNRKSGTIYCRTVALKRIEKAKVNPQEIKREVKALLSISTKCENILDYYESFEDKFFHYLCLELMDGDLRRFVEDRSARAVIRKRAVQAAQDIVNGLAYLHENQFIHRDLKPGNILYAIYPSLQFKIADFGLAKSVSSQPTMTSTVAGGVAMAPGTRCWMAPELVSLRSRDHTEKSDVFALGLVLHYLLSFGKHPFVGAVEEPAHVTEKNIVDMKMKIDAALSQEASSFIWVLLTKDPSRRPPAQYLKQHPFLWSDKKKIEFLKAVGDQPEAVNPSNYPNSTLELFLQMTNVGKVVVQKPWSQRVPELFSEMRRAWKQKKYRPSQVIDLVRFLRNAYAHKEERSLSVKHQIDSNIFLKEFPSLVLDVLGAVQKGGFDKSRSGIKQILSTS